MSDPANPAAPAAPAASPAPAAPAPPAPPTPPPPPVAAKPRVATTGRAPFLARRPATAPVVAAAPPADAPAVAPAAPPASRVKVPARVARELEELRAANGELKAHRAATAHHNRLALEAMPENVRAFIGKVAGDNPLAVSRAIAEARAAGLLAAPGVPAGATTGHPPAPAPATPDDAETSLARQYNQLVADGKARAADILHTLHGARIDRGLAKLAARN